MEEHLAEMAADPEMRRELAEIAQEFAYAELDGLETNHIAINIQD